MEPDIQHMRCGDVRLCVGVAGGGPQVLFLGGTGWDLRALPNPLYSSLTEDFQVALFDQRGQGRSDKPPGPYSMAGYAQDALAVADKLGWERPSVIGYSFGGMVAQEYAIRFPDRLNKLVLAATTPGGAGGSSYPIHEFLPLAPPIRAQRGLEVSDLRFCELQASNPKRAAQMVAARMESQTRYINEPGARAGLEAQLEARSHHDCFERLPQITAPTLVLAGVHDGQAPMNCQRPMVSQIKDCSLQTIEGAHGFLSENDDAYVEIRAFLKAKPVQGRRLADIHYR